MVNQVSHAQSISNTWLQHSQEPPALYLSSLLGSAVDQLSRIEVTNPLDTKITEYFGSFRHDAQTLLDSIEARRMQIRDLKENFSHYAEKTKKLEKNFYEEVEVALAEGELVPVENGAGATYFLKDGSGEYKFAVKPFDEEIFALNNRKGLNGVDNGEEVRRGIPLYRSTQIDVAVSRIAEIAGIGDITPHTEMVIIDSKTFHDFSSHFTADEQVELARRFGPADSERLCSVQRFLPGARDFMDVRFEMQADGVSDKEFEKYFDQDDFEKINILMMLTGETDGHGGNIMVYPKSKADNGKTIWGFRKVDNALSMPTVNGGFYNSLADMPGAQKIFSEKSLALIANLNVDTFKAMLSELELEDTMPAFMERLEKLQTLSSQGKTIEEINEAIGTRKDTSSTNELPTDEIEKMFKVLRDPNLRKEWKLTGKSRFDILKKDRQEIADFLCNVVGISKRTVSDEKDLFDAFKSAVRKDLMKLLVVFDTSTSLGEET